MASGSSSTPPPQRVPGPSQNQKYKDLLIFEERLKQNLHALKGRQHKHEALLGSNCLLIAVFSYFVLINRVHNLVVYYLCLICLVASISHFALFFLTGAYAEKIRTGKKYVPQCNRVLRSFNMHFNRDNKGELAFYRKIPRKFQEGFEKYRKLYNTKKREKKGEKEKREEEEGKRK